MIYQPLEKAGLIESCQVSKREIKDLLELALMITKGYRPKGPDRHKTIIRFLQTTVDISFSRGYFRR